MEHTLKVSGLSCGACERIVERTIQQSGSANILAFDFQRGTVKLEAERNK
ncbi:MAG: hypothetical protein V1847_03855 [Candidatus Diapherotrites archaeon]